MTNITIDPAARIGALVTQAEVIATTRDTVRLRFSSAADREEFSAVLRLHANGNPRPLLIAPGSVAERD